jgi:hypothetical protein
METVRYAWQRKLHMTASHSVTTKKSVFNIHQNITKFILTLGYKCLRWHICMYIYRHIPLWDQSNDIIQHIHKCGVTFCIKPAHSMFLRYLRVLCATLAQFLSWHRLAQYSCTNQTHFSSFFLVLDNIVTEYAYGCTLNFWNSLTSTCDVHLSWLGWPPWLMLCSSTASFIMNCKVFYALSINDAVKQATSLPHTTLIALQYTTHCKDSPYSDITNQ